MFLLTPHVPARPLASAWYMPLALPIILAAHHPLLTNKAVMLAAVVAVVQIARASPCRLTSSRSSSGVLKSGISPTPPPPAGQRCPPLPDYRAGPQRLDTGASGYHGSTGQPICRAHHEFHTRPARHSCDTWPAFAASHGGGDVHAGPRCLAGNGSR